LVHNNTVHNVHDKEQVPRMCLRYYNFIYIRHNVIEKEIIEKHEES